MSEPDGTSCGGQFKRAPEPSPLGSIYWKSLLPRQLQSSSGFGLISRRLDRRPDCLHHFAYEFVRVLQHRRIRNAQQSNAEGEQIIFFASIFAHLVDLRVDAAIELKGEPMFEEVPRGDAGHSEVSSSQLSAVRRALGNRATPQATMMNPCENVRTGNIITCDDGRKAEPIFTRTFRRFHFRLVHASYLGH